MKYIISFIFFPLILLIIALFMIFSGTEFCQKDKHGVMQCVDKCTFSNGAMQCRPRQYADKCKKMNR